MNLAYTPQNIPNNVSSVQSSLFNIGSSTQNDNKTMSKRERIKDNKKNGVACCPKCGSTSLSASKQGFGVGKAIVGASLTGPIGLVAGNINSKKVFVTCLNCGHRFQPGKK